MAEFTKCSVCLGEPLPSGKPCICGGIGTEQAEMHGLRSALFDADEEIDRLRAENERLRDLLRACLRGMRRYDWDVLEEGVSMPYGERTLREQVAQEVDDA